MAIAPALDGMRLPVDPTKLLKMTWPLYALIAVGMAGSRAEWLRPTPSVLFALLAPLLLPVLGWLVGIDGLWN